MQKKTASLLTGAGNVARSAMIWNALSACLTSFQTMLLLMVITHSGSPEHSGYFVMAYTVANLLMHLGKFGMRQYQVTDAGEKYSFREYIASRFFTTGLMAAALFLYLLWSLLFNGYTAEKAAAVALITLYRGIEAAEDVIHGRMQQKGRLDVAAKILAIRSGVFLLGFALCYLWTKQLVLTCVVNTLISLLLCVLLNRAALPAAGGQAGETRSAFPWSLVRECLPLCLTMVAYMYLGNAPKYTVDGLVSEEVQTAFNIVIMPAFVGSLLCSFLFNPILRRIGVLWQERKTGELRATVRKLALVPVAVDAALLLGGWFLGIPVLSAVYGVSLEGYRSTLMIFLLASGMIAMLNLFVSLLTAMRKQRHLLGAYAAASLMLVLSGRPLFRAWGLNPMCLAYLAVLFLVLLYCAGIYLRTVIQAQRDGADTDGSETPAFDREKDSSI